MTTKFSLVLIVLALTGCATTVPATAPFERCMTALKGVEYTGDKLRSAEWCAKNGNGGIK